MKYELPCEIVQDLLPSYVDELASDVTADSVAAHLEGCPDCREIFQHMKAPAQISETEHSQKDQKEIDFLKKTRKRGINGSLLASLITLCILLAIFGGARYMLGETVKTPALKYVIHKDDVGFWLTGHMQDPERAISNVTWTEEHGELKLCVKSVHRSFLHNQDLNELYHPQEEIHRVTMEDGLVIWDDGVMIGPVASALYDRQTPYVGDAPAVGALIQSAGLSEYYSYQHMRIDSWEEKPDYYGLTLLPGDDISREMLQEYQQILPRYGALLIASVGNLKTVTFELSVEGKICGVSITNEEADALAGFSVKTCSDSPRLMQQLVSTLELYHLPYYREEADSFVEDHFDLNLELEEIEHLIGLGLALKVNGETYCSQAVINADESELKAGMLTKFEYTPETAERRIDMQNDTVELCITLYEDDPNLTRQFGEVNLLLDPNDPEYYDGNTYRRVITLHGNRDSGYFLQ